MKKVINPFIDVNAESSQELIKSIKVLYICPTFQCNNSCSHCFLRTLPYKLELEKVVKSIEKILEINKTLSFDLFGGEPFTLSDEQLNYLEPYIFQRPLTLNSNLLFRNLSTYKWGLLKKADSVDTSFDFNRFDNPELLDIWLRNVDRLKEDKIKFNTMTVMDHSTIKWEPKEFIKLLNSINPAFVELKFFVGKGGPDPNKVDNWLCDLMDSWTIKSGNLLFAEFARIILEGRKWKDYCINKNYSLFPDGKLRMGCPYGAYVLSKPECKFCQYFNVCGSGCMLQESCNFPKKLYEKMLKLDISELLRFKNWNAGTAN